MIASIKLGRIWFDFCGDNKGQQIGVVFTLNSGLGLGLLSSALGFKQLYV